MNCNEKMPLIDQEVKLPDFTGGRLSPTQITMYLRCPLQYFHRYVRGSKEPPGVALIEGSAHHASLEMNNKHKVNTKEDLPVKLVVEKFEDDFNTKKKDIGDWEKETTESVISRGRGILKVYFSEFAPKLQPELVEHEFILNIGSVPVLGYMDVAGKVENNKNVAVDYKVVSRAKTQAEILGDIQLGFYGWGLKKKLLFEDSSTDNNLPVFSGFCMLKKTKRPEVEWSCCKITNNRLLWLRQLVLHVAHSIQKGSFPPCDPTSWACSSKFCGYYKECRGKFDV